jgi:hypothetical protein
MAHPITIPALTVSGVPASTRIRSYTSSAQLITEMANAPGLGRRALRFSTTADTATSMAVARFDYKRALQPVQDDDGTSLL